MDELISENQVLELLYSSCPQFKTVAENELDAEDRKLSYIVAEIFAHFLLEAYKSGQKDVLESAAKFIETIHLHGNEKVRELGTIGYLEGIQNVWENNNTDPANFYTYLLPESKKRWDELNKFWEGKVKYVGESFSQES